MEPNNRERIKGRDFVKGGVYEVYDKDYDRYSRGIYFYPTSYPERMEYEYNTRGAFSKATDFLSKPLILKKIYDSSGEKYTKYTKFDKSKIYGKKPISIVKSDRWNSRLLDLSKLDLSYADLKNSKLININFTEANFTGANFTGANFTGSDFTNAELNGAELGNTILKDIKSSGIKGIPKTLPKGYYFIEGCIIGPDTNISSALSDRYEKIEVKGKEYLLGPNVDLTGADFHKIKLIGTDLTGAKLTGADLTGADFYKIKLTGADLTDVDLTDAILHHAILTGIKTSGIKGIPKNLPKGYFLVDGIIIGPDIDIPNNENNTFNTIKLKKKYKKIKITIKNKNKNVTTEYLIGPNVNLNSADLTGADLSNVDLTSAILTATKLTGANFTGVDLTDTDLEYAKLSGIKSGRIRGIPKNLPYGYVLINGYIIGPNVNLIDADLTGVDLTNVDLTGADLTGAKLIRANLTGTKLIGANFTGVDLTGANLTGTDLTKIKSGKIKGKPQKLPDYYVLRIGYMIGPNVNLIGADLTGANLTGVYLDNADLTDADLTGADLTDIDLTGVDLTGAKLIGANFTGVDLTGANLTGTDLTKIKSGKIRGKPQKLPDYYVLRIGYMIGPNVNLTGADLKYTTLIDVNLTGAILTGAILTGIKSGGIKGNPTLPDGYVLINGYIIGRNVDLTGADLTAADLTGIVSGGIKGEPKLPRRYVLVDGYIFGPNVNLSGKKVSKIDLTYVNLSGSDLTHAVLEYGSLLSYANLKRCNLTGAILVGVDLTRANLESADLTGTKLFANSLSEKQKQQIIGEPVYIENNLNLLILPISKRITDGKNKINKEQMERARATVRNKNNEHAIREAYNKRMERKRELIKEDKKGSMKESIRTSFLEKEQREPTQNEINRIYKNTKKRIKDSKKESIKKSFLEKEQREPTQKEINSIYKNTKKQKNNKNFSDLLDYLLDKKNQVQISKQFHIVGEIGINAGGLTRSIFEKCYKIFIERYFIEYNFNENNYVILKDLNEELFEEFKKACEFMILLARRGGVKILIQINPQLLELLQLGKLKYYKKYVLLNNSNNSFSLKRIQNGINNYSNESFNLKRIHRQKRFELNNNSKNSFNLERIQRQKRSEINESNLIEPILENNKILSAEHFNKVKEFYILFWKTNPDVFTNHIDYSWDNFKERLRFQLPNSHLDSFNSFDEFMTEENAQINTYPFIELILDYLKYSDEYRMRFTTLTCGSYTYTGHIYIKIFNNHSILDPFNAHTCSQTIDVNIKLSDSYPVLYHELFCERSNQVVNNQNESGNGNGRVNNPNESGRVNGRGSNQNERENENGRGSNPNERVNPIVNNVIESNESRRGSNPNEHGRVNNKSCRYLIEKLDKLILMAISQGFNIA